jgi:hypothetical protein
MVASAVQRQYIAVTIIAKAFGIGRGAVHATCIPTGIARKGMLAQALKAVQLQQIAHAFGVTAEAIKNFSEEAVFNYFNNFHDNSSGDFRQHCTFNPIDKIVELYDEKVALLERLLQSEREKVKLLKGK